MYEVDGQYWEAERTNPEPVRIMALAEGYAMVRYPGLEPFTIAVTDLRPYAADEPLKDTPMPAHNTFEFDISHEKLTEIIDNFADSLEEAIEHGEEAGACYYGNHDKAMAQIIAGLHLVAMAAHAWKL